MEHVKLQNEALNRISNEEFKEAKKAPIVLVLDNLRSQNNVGSFFRTGDAFRIEKVVLCGITSTPDNREVHKTALGAEKTVAWEHHKDTVEAVRGLKEAGYLVYAIEQATDSISLETFEMTPQMKCAFVFGHEVKGVQQEVINLCDGVIEIPQFGTKHSFNVAVTAGMVMWQAIRPLLNELR
ncbi:MAG: RNA methyltransferase [Marinifilaceae bacterium]